MSNINGDSRQGLLPELAEALDVRLVVACLKDMRGRSLPKEIVDFLYENWCEYCGDPQDFTHNNIRC